MLKKRVIFTLLYSNGQFMLSRNFRLQKVGSLEWLQANYNFSQISFSIDELVVLDVTRGEKCLDRFCSALKKLAEGCFAPIAAGGGVHSIEAARKLLRAGADKIVINTSLYEGSGFASHLASEFGRQCVVGSIDIKKSNHGIYQVWKDNGSICLEGDGAKWVEQIANDEVGELYLNSIDQDGTGQGYDLRLLDLLPDYVSMPVILAGGVGNVNHLAEGLADNRVDAVATAHLFNFVGDGLRRARNKLISNGLDLPFWDVQMLDQQLSNARNI